MSVEEILAACRQQDGGGGGAAAQTAPATKSNSPSEPTLEAAPTPAKKPGEMSVAEMLAAARAGDGGGAKPAAEKPVASPKAAASTKKPGELSVAEMMAAARAEVAGGKEVAPKSAAKPTAKKPTAKASSKATVAPKKPSGPKDTTSILAAARSSAKPGPISKAEAAKRAKEPDAPVRPKATALAMPLKPDYARLTATPAGTGERRGFVVALAAVFAGTFFITSSLAIGFSSLAVTSLLWVLGLARFMFPNILTEPPTKFKVGSPDEYAPGQVATKFKAQFGVWVARYEYDGQAEIYALQSVCTHLGCTPNWLEGEQKFKCPCHGSGFYKDGINFEGPAPRPLERFAIRLADDGQLEVDKSRKFKEEVGQWSDPASYVPV